MLKSIMIGLCVATLIVWRSPPVHGCETESRIVFVSNNDRVDLSVAGIYSVLPDGSNISKLAVENALSATWSPDGTELALIIHDNDTTTLARMEFENSDIIDIVDTENQVLKHDGVTHIFSPTWSPDGEYIAFVATIRGEEQTDGSSKYYTDVYKLELGGGIITRLTNDGASEGDLDWSPDGEKIAFVSDLDNEDEFYTYSIHTIDSDGTRRRFPNPFPSDQKSPRWTSDSTRIIFAANLIGWGLYIMDTSDMTTEPLIENIPDIYNIDGLSWSPDYQRVAFRGCDGTSSGCEIYALEISSGEITRLTNNDYYDGSPSWQPTGRK